MKKILFRLAAVLLTAAMLFTLLACKDDDDDGDEGFNPYPYDDLSVYMDLPDYKSITVKRSELDKMINAELMSFCIRNGLADSVTSGGVQRYDQVSVYYIAYIGGQSIEELSLREGEYTVPADLLIGSGVLPFEEGVLGMTVGETRSVAVTLPTDYPYAEYRGQEAVFVVDLDGIIRMRELTDAICVEKSVYGSKAEFMEALEDNLVFDYAWQSIMSKCTLKGYPNKEYTEYYQYFYGYFETIAESEDMKFEDFLKEKGGYYRSYGLFRGMTVAQFRDLADSYAKSNLVNDLLTYSIMRAEDIKLEGAEWDTAVAIFEREQGTSFDAIAKEAGENAAIISVLTVRISQVINSYVTVIQ